MAENKQPQLNGAFHGPSIPPPNNHSNHHRGRTCCCCLFSFFWKLLLAIIFLIILAFIIFLLIVQPRPFKFYVTEANLTQFNYTTNTKTLNYNLVLNFTARNPNKKVGFLYDNVDGNAFYEDSRFSSVNVINWLNSFRQYTKHSDPMSGVFSGQNKVFVLDQSQISKFDQDKKDGAFDIYVKLHFKMRFYIGDFTFHNLNTRADAKCRIKVPISNGSNGKNVVGAPFEPTKCHVLIKWL